MIKYQKLFEFLIELIDVQIQKYTALTQIGIGPDAGISAQLIVDEVFELMEYANTALRILNSQQYDDEHTFQNIFQQTRFYLEQEYLRSYAGWLIDENKIHTPEFERLKKQKEEFYTLAALTQIDTRSPAGPINDKQRQCEHDSNEIALLILQEAIDLRANPNKEFSANIPSHAQKILRKHATKEGRFHKPELWSEIQAIHSQCSEFKSHSSLQKTNHVLSKEEAKLLSANHIKELDRLKENYKKLNPVSKIFSSHYERYTIPINSKFKYQQSDNTYSFSKSGLFGGLALAGAAAICLFISYLAQNYNENILKNLQSYR